MNRCFYYPFSVALDFQIHSTCLLLPKYTQLRPYMVAVYRYETLQHSKAIFIV